MSESIEIHESVRVFVRSVDEAPEDVDLELADKDDPGEYYYEVSLHNLGEKVGKRYVRYDGPEGHGFYDTRRGVLKTRPRVKDEETNENTIKNEIFNKADRILDKYKIYISDADTYSEAEQMAPDWADVQETEQGAFYYEKLPGQGEGGDGEERETGDYDVGGDFGEIVADRVLNDDVGDIPVDDFHEHLSSIDDTELIKDCLRAEMDGPDRKTGKQFIEARARELGIDVDALKKEPGPDVTGDDMLESLSEMEVKPEELSDEIVVSADENDHTTQDWSVRKIWDVYIEGGKAMPVGMGNPGDIPAGTLSTVLEEEVDDPAVLMQFWEEGNYQTKRDVKDALQERGYDPRVETVSGEYRFDLDEMERFMDEDEAKESLSEGDFVYIPDFNGGILPGYISEVLEDEFIIQSPDSRSNSVVLHDEIIRDEFALGEIVEQDGLHEQVKLGRWKPEDLEFIDRIDDDSVLQRAVNLDEEDNEMSFSSEVFDTIKQRLLDLDPPEPSDYGMDEESFNLLHGAKWPEWDESGAKKQGSGVSDDLRSIYEQASTEDLKKYAQVCEDADLQNRRDVVNGMLFYRENSDVGLRDLFEYEQKAHGNYRGVTDDAEDKIMGAAEDTMHSVEPHIGAQLAGHIETFELQKPADDDSWGGQAQSGGRVMAIDDPTNKEKTTSHEMGHAFHNFMGIKNDGYSRIDNRDNEDSPEDWEFGAKPPSNDNENAQEFYGDMKEEWDEYVETQMGNSDEANELRPYQKRHGVELIAVGFAHWVQDPYKIRNRHPDLAAKFDKHVGEGAEERIEVDEVEEGQFIDIALSRGSTATVKVTGINETSHGYDFDFEVMEGSKRASGIIPDDEFVVEGISDDYQPLDFDHGTMYEVEMGGEAEEVIMDQETRARGGDFVLRNKYGEIRGQWTKRQLRDNLVEQRPIGETEVPWSIDDAGEGDILEVRGQEVQIERVDDWDNEIVYRTSEGTEASVDFGEVYDLRESGELEPVSSEVEWEEITSNEEYSFISDDATYNGEVVGITQDEVEIEQGIGGTGTIDRDEINEIKRRV